MKKTMYFNSEAEMNEYFKDGIPSNVLAVVQPDESDKAVLFTTSNNTSATGTMEDLGGYNIDEDDRKKIEYSYEGVQNYYTYGATQSYVADYVSTYGGGSDVDLTGYATESYVVSKIEDVVGAAPAALDTLKEIGDSLNNDADFAGTMTTALAGKADKSELNSYVSYSYLADQHYLKVQAQADWTVESSISAAYIRNKPDLSNFATQSYVADYVSTYGGGSQAQADWNETNSTYASYILNKPDLDNVAFYENSEDFVDANLTNIIDRNADASEDGFLDTGTIVARYYDQPLNNGTYPAAIGIGMVEYEDENENIQRVPAVIDTHWEVPESNAKAPVADPELKQTYKELATKEYVESLIGTALSLSEVIVGEETEPTVEDGWYITIGDDDTLIPFVYDDEAGMYKIDDINDYASENLTKAPAPPSFTFKVFQYEDGEATEWFVDSEKEFNICVHGSGDPMTMTTEDLGGSLYYQNVNNKQDVVLCVNAYDNDGTLEALMYCTWYEDR